MVDRPLDSASLLALAKIAVLLPLLRPRAFLRSAGLLIGCLIIGGALSAILTYLIQVTSGDMKEKLPVLLSASLGITLLGVFAGLRSFATNWRRVAYAWPEDPGKIPLFNLRRRPFGASFSLFADPGMLFLEMVVVVPVSLLCVVAILGFFFAHFALGLAALYVFPLLPLALITNFRWPQDDFPAVDAVPIGARRARELAKASFSYRMAAYLWIWAPTWALTLTAYGIVQFGVISRAPYFFQLPLIGVPVLIGAAWIHGIGARLYARLSEPISVFD